jgi:hypothetical protein
MVERKYTIEMFHQDQNEILSKIPPPPKVDPETQGSLAPTFTFQDVMELFIAKYKKARGTDFCMRFLGVMQFIDHYKADLMLKGYMKKEKEDAMQVQNELLQVLLDSFKTPQPPNVMASSSLLNQEHEFNYKKVIKAMEALGK